MNNGEKKQDVSINAKDEILEKFIELDNEIKRLNRLFKIIEIGFVFAVACIVSSAHFFSVRKFAVGICSLAVGLAIAIFCVALSFRLEKKVVF